MILNTVEELWKGISNAPIAAFALIAGVLLLFEKGVKWEWRAICLETAFASFLGMFVHIFKLPEIYRKLIWVLLYAVLFEVIRLFGHRAAVYITQNERKERLMTRIIEIALYLEAVVLLFITNGWDMAMLVLFSLLCVIRIVMAIIKHPCVPKLFFVLLGIAALAVIILALKSFIPYAVVICHILIALSIVIFYFIAVKDK